MRAMGKFRGLLTGLALPLLASVGCYSARPMQHIQFQQASVIQEGEGIRITIEPLDTDEECAAFFSDDLRKSGYFPVYLGIDNTSEYRTIYFNGAKTEFFDSAGVRWNNIDAWDTGRDLAKNSEIRASIGAALSGATFSPTGIATAYFTHRHNNKREEDLKKKLMPPWIKSIYPGKSLEGCVVFAAPDKDDLTSKEQSPRIRDGKLVIPYSVGGEDTSREIIIGEAKNFLVQR